MLAQDAQQRPTAHHSANENTQWQRWLNSSVSRLECANLLRTLHPVSTTLSPVEVCSGRTSGRTSTGLIPLLMSMLVSQVEISHVTFQEWHDSIADISGSDHMVASQVQLFPRIRTSTEKHALGNCLCHTSLDAMQVSMRLKLFSLNDYMGLSQHPAICKAAAEAATLCGMGKLLQNSFRSACVHLAMTLCTCGCRCTDKQLQYWENTIFLIPCCGQRQSRNCASVLFRSQVFCPSRRLYTDAPRLGNIPSCAQGHRRLPAVLLRLCSKLGCSFCPLSRSRSCHLF